MTSRGANTRWNIDIRGALSQLDRLQDRARQVARRVDNTTLGLGGRAGRGLGAVGRGGRGLGTALAAGAGIGAGIAVVEQFFEKLIELFEGTTVLTQFTEVLDKIFMAAGPLVGVLLTALLPVLEALLPAVEPLAMAFAPLIELLGGALLTAVTLAVPLIIKFAEGMEAVTTKVRDVVLRVIRQIFDFLNRLPGVDLELPEFQTDTFEAARRDLEQAAFRRSLEEAGMIGPREAGGRGRGSAQDTEPVIINVALDDVVVQRTSRQVARRRRELGA